MAMYDLEGKVKLKLENNTTTEPTIVKLRKNDDSDEAQIESINCHSGATPYDQKTKKAQVSEPVKSFKDKYITPIIIGTIILIIGVAINEILKTLNP